MQWVKDGAEKALESGNALTGRVRDRVRSLKKQDSVASNISTMSNRQSRENPGLFRRIGTFGRRMHDRDGGRRRDSRSR